MTAPMSYGNWEIGEEVEMTSGGFSVRGRVVRISPTLISVADVNCPQRIRRFRRTSYSGNIHLGAGTSAAWNMYRPKADTSKEVGPM